ncbi:hypothetical protein ANCCEY_01374 [Ancylostoma ceylanicum]|uniref:Attacin C-terminal domain-containing protein n=1 Tax=Ancylostoma ceylanicum TaxID=53326 RepID=A0A0D6M5X3_9BILA|nr:hypothetical protein ANCCEY_01374 [Ancylostoma ceylanicum]
MRISTRVPIWILLAITLASSVSAQWNPNHVSINEKRKHIEADSSWLDKRQQEVQRVAQLRTKEDDTGRHAFLKADGQYDLDTVASGDLKDPAKTSFAATNDRFDFNLNPKTHDNHTGTGIVGFNDKVSKQL